MSVDDILWWLYENHKLVVGGRTIRRVFERRNTSHQKLRHEIQSGRRESNGLAFEPAPMPIFTDDRPVYTQPQVSSYQSPYAPIAPPTTTTTTTTAATTTSEPTQPATANPIDNDITAEEVALQASLHEILAQKRSIEQKLKALRQRRSHPPSSSTKSPHPDPAPAATARQARMLSALQTRSRKRSTLATSWVEGKDIWPAGAQAVLVDALWRYSGCDEDALFEAVYGAVYELVDSAGWEEVHDGLLRERVRRKIAGMAQRGSAGFAWQGHGLGQSRFDDEQGNMDGYDVLDPVEAIEGRDGRGDGVAPAEERAMETESGYPIAGTAEQSHYPIPIDDTQGSSTSRNSLEQDLQHAMAGADGSGDDAMPL